jgi:hypothetical protein
MIDFKIYNLVYYRDGQRFAGRRVCQGRYVLINVITNEKSEYSRWTLDKNFTKDSENRKAQTREFKKGA